MSSMMCFLSLKVDDLIWTAHERSKGKVRPITPDGRYFVVKDKLWRCTNPHLPEGILQTALRDLMNARRAIKGAKGEAELKFARARVHAAKVFLGEKGPVWWNDGASDVDRHHPKNTQYAEWWAAFSGANDSEPAEERFSTTMAMETIPCLSHRDEELHPHRYHRSVRKLPQPIENQ